MEDRTNGLGRTMASFVRTDKTETITLFFIFFLICICQARRRLEGTGDLGPGQTDESLAEKCGNVESPLIEHCPQIGLKCIESAYSLRVMAVLKDDEVARFKKLVAFGADTEG